MKRIGDRVFSEGLTAASSACNRLAEARHADAIGHFATRDRWIGKYVTESLHALDLLGFPVRDGSLTSKVSIALVAAVSDHVKDQLEGGE